MKKQRFVVAMVIIYLSMVTACSTMGQFDKSGKYVDPTKLVYAGFHNSTDSSFTVSVWEEGHPSRYIKTATGKDFHNLLILPGNIEIAMASGGRYEYQISRGVGTSNRGNLIFWDEGDFLVNGKLVDVSINLEHLWKSAGGEGGGGKYKL